MRSLTNFVNFLINDFFETDELGKGSTIDVNEVTKLQKELLGVNGCSEDALTYTLGLNKPP